jgi:FG-GAP-like repeat
MSKPIALFTWLGIAFLLLLLLAEVAYFYYSIKCIDGCGPYHNRASVADLDGDGDLDVVLSNLRHETETIVWAGATLWINQGGGKFAPRRGDFGGPYATAGDVNGDGDVDLLRWANDAIQIHINYGEDDPTYGGFRVSYGIRPVEDPPNRSVTANGSIALGDLNGDGRLDAFVSNWGASLIDKRDDLFPYLPWVWINTPDENGYPKGVGLNLQSLGNLPMQATLGDLDGDGDLDVYAASLPPKGGNYDSADRILWNDGSGAFVDSGQRLDNPREAGAAGSGSVALGDLDGDGDLDALVATADGAALWINQGRAQGRQTGIFAESGQRLGRGHIEAVFLADLDGDGDLDAAVGGKDQASIWWNDGRAGFSDSGQRLRYTERDGLAVGDFNGDGYPDVFSAAGDTEYHLWLNQGDGRLQGGN